MTTQTLSDLDDNPLIDLLSSSTRLSIQNQARDRLSTPHISSFLSSLTSHSLPSLLAQPATLASEAAQLTNSLTNLCTSEYSTFLSLHSTSSVLSSSLDALGSSLDALLGQALPALEERTREFVQETQGVRERRRKAKVVLEREDALVDILEIPALIDTCVRNGHYQEALDLVAHARSLARSSVLADANELNNNVPIDPTGDVLLIRAIAEEAEYALFQMRAQLLALLQTPSKLPALYKAISFLRKMDANLDESVTLQSSSIRLRARLTEPELALAFLTSRLTYLEAVLNGIEKTSGGEGVEIDHARYLRKYIDSWREGVHDIVTQYTTIFLDRSLHSYAQVHTNQSKSRVAAQDGTVHNYESTLHVLLATTAQHLLYAHLLPTLTSHLEHVSDALALSALLTQLTHCSTGCARFGLDFRSSLPPLFERAVLRRFEDAVDVAATRFVSVLKDAQKYSRIPSRWVLTDPSNTNIGEDQPLASPLPSPNLSPNLRIPPTLLASYRPLAELTNSLLDALNNLRLLAPTSLLDPLLSALDGALLRASGEFLGYCKEFAGEVRKGTVSGSTRRSEDGIGDGKKVDQVGVLRAAGRAFVGVLVPFVRRGLAEGVYGVEGGVDLSGELKEQLSLWDEWLGVDAPRSS